MNRVRRRKREAISLFCCVVVVCLGGGVDGVGLARRVTSSYLMQWSLTVSVDELGAASL